MKNKELLVNFPESLRLLPQWVLWRYETKEDGKQTKVPYQMNGCKAAVSRPDEWTSLEQCLKVVDNFDGVGFIFTKGVVGIDLDKCFEFDGTLKEFAQDILLSFDSYTEVSPSGNGLHILILSDVPLDGRKKNGIECYSSGRFFTVTGNVFQDRHMLKDCDISAWYKEIFGDEKAKKPLLTQTSGYLPDDEKILSVMFKSRRGEKIRALYEEGKWQESGFGSPSEADLCLIGFLMFFCRNNMVVADRLFRKSKLMRSKWDEMRGRETYGQQTMEAAVKSEIMQWKEPVEGYLMSGGEHPVPLLVLENICRVFDQEDAMRNHFRLNDFSHMIEAEHHGIWLNLQENDILEVQRYIAVNYIFFARVSKEMVTDAIRCISNQNKVNPPVDYLNGLTWDKVSRLDSWLHTVFGVPDDRLHSAIGSNWLKGLVKRVLEPGYQFDEVLVLEGDQGYRKSSALRALGSPWHVESTLSTEDKDFYMLLARNVIVEFSEGDIVGRTSARKLKGIITKTEDSYRPPYERGLMTFKRGCVFAMTTNDGDYQKDETGGRRWLPVVLEKKADVEWLKENRDQLYAEAVHRVEILKETTHEYPQEELAMLQGSKLEYDEISEPIQDWYNGLPSLVREDGVLTIDAYNGALSSKKDNQWTTVDDEKEIPQQMTWRIAKVFKTVLGLRNKPLRKNGKLRKRWFA